MMHNTYCSERVMQSHVEESHFWLLLDKSVLACLPTSYIIAVFMMKILRLVRNQVELVD